jgi:hypothetical protein
MIKNKRINCREFAHISLDHALDSKWHICPPEYPHHKITHMELLGEIGP